MNTLRRKWQSLPRGIVVLITALVIYTPLSFIVIQSFLSAPFFSPAKEWSFESFDFIFTDPDFYKALKSGFILAFGLVFIHSAGRRAGVSDGAYRFARPPAD
jgi:iron(III) transport system permease protein